ncbi:Bacteroides conjugative transposon TraN protein [Dyadobacter sp. SG02]|uniref:conjugative transposon protein TraN n=1 Tax=Dyadobacter sp. SG02 TaxID=1855291 RepID=UPI0008AAF5E7|nr:conjugative transposon protein TraN [Dyadobacter sp. SG02]SEJ74481.1 Bacteroides conjugative transposon TraN protein [Dyadobacter sp. SG02]
MKKLMLLISLFSIVSKIHGQNTDSSLVVPNSIRTYTDIRLKANPYMLPIAASSIRGSYPVELSFAKTTHIVFPSRIVDFDAGSDVVIATVPDPVQNILRVKADVKGFYDETNMTVLTEDGGLYSFLVRYNDNPDVVTINISNNVIADEMATKHLGIGLSSNSSPNAYVLGGGVYNEEAVKTNCLKVSDYKGFIKHIGAKKDGLRTLLKGVYQEDELIYFKLEIENSSLMPYTLDFVKVFMRDRNQVKRTAVQEEELNVVGIYPVNNAQVPYTSRTTKVIAIPRITLTDGKLLEIEVYERKGGRHMKFKIDNDTLLRTKNI